MPEEEIVEYTLEAAAELLEEWMTKYREAGAWEELESRTTGFLFLHRLSSHGVVSGSVQRRFTEEVEAQQKERAGTAYVGSHRKEGDWRGRVF